jgi:hypothetical protein
VLSGSLAARLFLILWRVFTNHFCVKAAGASNVWNLEKSSDFSTSFGLSSHLLPCSSQLVSFSFPHFVLVNIFVNLSGFLGKLGYLGIFSSPSLSSLLSDGFFTLLIFSCRGWKYFSQERVKYSFHSNQLFCSLKRAKIDMVFLCM